MGYRDAIIYAIILFLIGAIIGFWLSDIGNYTPEITVIMILFLGIPLGSYGWKYGIKKD